MTLQFKINNTEVLQNHDTLTVGDVVAVYGTLRKDQGNNINLGLNLSERATFLGTTTIEGYLVSLGGFPGFISDPEQEGLPVGPVVVDLYEIKTVDLGYSLDRLEGYSPSLKSVNNFYIRSNITTTCGVECQTYVYMGGYKGRRHIEDGDWVGYRYDR